MHADFLREYRHIHVEDDQLHAAVQREVALVEDHAGSVLYHTEYNPYFRTKPCALASSCESPLVCALCGAAMHVLAAITDPQQV